MMMFEAKMAGLKPSQAQKCVTRSSALGFLGEPMSRELIDMLAIPLSGLMLLIAAYASGPFELRTSQPFHAARFAAQQPTP